MIPTSATKTRSVTAAIGSAIAAAIAASSRSRAANASTRSPRSDSLRLAARISSRTVPIGTCSPCHSARPQRSMTTSGAPLTVTKCGSCRIPPASESGRSWKVAMNLYSESNGTSARRGSASRVSRGVGAHLRGQHHEGRLGRIADDRLVIGDGGVGAQDQAQRQAAEVRQLPSGHAQDRAGLLVAGALDPEPVAAGQHRGRRHRVHRQRAGLVGVDDASSRRGSRRR